MKKPIRKQTHVTPDTLIIGDIHHRTDLADALIAKHGPRCGQIVFLGDYFDDFGDNPERMRRTCRWLAASLQQPNRVHLLGNHDFAYLMSYHGQSNCPGWTCEKQVVFQGEIESLPLEAFRVAVRVGPWLLSHAGVSAQQARGLDAARMVKKIESEFARAKEGHDSWIFDRGFSRGGYASHSGILWQDWAQEFRPIDFLHQIVGHSPSRGVARAKCLTHAGTHRQFEFVVTGTMPKKSSLPQLDGETWSSVNWCLDTELLTAGIVGLNGFELVV